MTNALKQIFAKLASTSDLGRLSAKSKRALVAAAEDAGIRPDVLLPRGQRALEHRPRMHPVPARAWGLPAAEAFACVTGIVGTSVRNQRGDTITVAPFAWGILWDVHPWVRELVALRLSRRFSLSADLLDDFLVSLKEAPLPYHRCPACAAIFARLAGKGRPKKFCCGACKTRWHDARRKNDPQRRESARKSMAKLRERHRAQISVPVRPSPAG